MMRAIAIARLLASGMSTGRVADALGFAYPESMLRTLRSSGGNVAMLKASGGLQRFEAQLQNAYVKGQAPSLVRDTVVE